MFKSVATDEVERVTIGQLGLPERLVLLRGGKEFQFGGDDLLHDVLAASYETTYKSMIWI